ncbi:MAG: phosphatidylinositol-specific phospholipase C1-like protein [Pseudomonadota bacterium]
MIKASHSAAALVLATACLEPATSADLESCDRPITSLRMNELQSIGSHNSYKLAIPEIELGVIRRQEPELASALDYSHISLTAQLDLGMRQLELDIFHDPDGGRFADPLLPRLASANGDGDPFDATGHDTPGLKVMHIQDIDQRSHCVLLTECLNEINTWSLANPEHTPILILINAKQAQIDIPGAAEALPFDATAFSDLDAEIRSIFTGDRLITPDTVRDNAATLREGVLGTGWPSLDDGQGRILFALDEPPKVVETYMRGKASLEGLPLFVNTIDPQADHVAYFTINDPEADNERIKQAVADGFLVRTRADADTVEARTNDRSRIEAALSSGAQYISTDYYLPRTDFGAYHVSLPGNAVTRCTASD